MNESKKQRLEAKGWKVGSVREFLGLTAAEAACIELKLILSESPKLKRIESGKTNENSSG